ncbi:hypothetical protein [Nocardioides montaniterrae]
MKYAARLLALVVTALLTALLAVTAAPAQAQRPHRPQEIYPVVAVGTTAAGVDWWDTIKTTIRWCTTAGMAKGDHFTVTLPAQVQAFRPRFEVFDTRKHPIAVARTINDAKVVQTLTVTPKPGTCAVTHLESQFRSDTVAGHDVPLTYTSGTRRWVDKVLVRKAQGPIRELANLWGDFTRLHDECRTKGHDCLLWNLDSPEGPFPKALFIQKMPGNELISCRTLTVTFVSLDSQGGVAGKSPYGAKVHCTPKGLRVDAGSVPAGGLVRLTYKASMRPVKPNGGVEFRTEFHVRLSKKRTDRTSDITRSTTADGLQVVPPSDQLISGKAADNTISNGDQEFWPYVVFGVVLLGALVSVVVNARKRGDAGTVEERARRR